MTKLNDAKIQKSLAGLAGWKIKSGKLHREYKFADFVAAFGFMAEAAFSCEKLGHHPDWANVYNRVTVNLTTHDAGGITKKDLDLAALLEAIAAKRQ
ncbi:MAG: 4a-hydroxytetrahydrobiopterin dehydratase [Bryobacteraceae bacterium]